MKRLTIIASLNSISSYGLHAIQIVRGLKARGIHPSIRVISRAEMFGEPLPGDVTAYVVKEPQPEKWELLLHPHGFHPTPGKQTAYYVAHESTRLPSKSVKIFNACNLVLTPSRWCETVLSAAGVTQPIRIVPLGVDQSLFHYKAPAGGPFTLGAGGRSVNGGSRKGINEVVNAFHRAFHSGEQVRLRLKCFHDCAISASLDNRIEVQRNFIPAEKMAEWYSYLHAFVSCAKAEGWGLMQHEAMSCGRPVIGTAFGGVCDFFNADNGIVVQHRLAPGEFGYTGLGHWAEPVEEDMVQKLRWAYLNRETLAEKGLKAALSVMPLSWENSIDQLVRTLEEFGVFEDNKMGHQFGFSPSRAAVFHRPSIDKGIVSLRRNGDIIALLPLLMKLASERKAPVKLVVHTDYMPLLEGVSYVEPVEWKGDMEDPLAAAKQTGAVNAQIFGRGVIPDTATKNFAKLPWEVLGYAWDRYLPLHFDMRDHLREEHLFDRTFTRGKPKILVKLDAISSPFAGAGDVMRRLQEAFSDDAEITDLSKVKAERIYDLIGLMNRSACLVTVDTATLWLAHASQCPVVALVHPKPFGASPPRGNCILRVRYQDADQRWPEIERAVAATITNLSSHGIVNVFSDWAPSDPSVKARLLRASNTWPLLKSRSLPFRPGIGRTSQKIGDVRGVPFVRDMIAAALNTGTEGIVVIHNNDIQVDSDLIEDIQTSCAKYGCWWAYRVEKPDGPTDYGADLFAFTRTWWNIHQHQFPDLLLGYRWWDRVMTRLMQWSGCPEGRRFYYHEKHPGIETRENSPGERYNQRLASIWNEQWDEPK